MFETVIQTYRDWFLCVVKVLLTVYVVFASFSYVTMYVGPDIDITRYMTLAPEWAVSWNTIT